MTAYLRDLLLGLDPELAIVTAVVFGVLAIVALANAMPLAFAWMHDAIGDEPSSVDAERLAIIAAEPNPLIDEIPAGHDGRVRTPLPALNWRDLAGVRHQVELTDDEDENDRRVFAAMKSIERLR